MTTTFAERLKNAMEQANVSQSDLSRRTGASKAAISQYLSGKNTPNMERIAALANATGVTLDYLIGYGAAPVAEPPIKKISVKEAARCMGKDSVNNGIQYIQGYTIIVHPRCVNFITEISNYTWAEDKFGAKINVPIDDFNHLMDAMRYGLEDMLVGPAFSFD